MAEKLYRVIHGDAGITQRTDDGFVARSLGDEIRLSPEAAEHLLGAGYVEEVEGLAASPFRRAKAEVSE
jgi:hypothetical protein